MQNNPNKVVLSTAYFPPVSYFEIILKSKEVFIEQHENYTKQTYRNRCEILSPG
ncbi:MAG: WbqC family protein, partial [Chlorobi bacterium]|nr:WbqC family protein [Chlorobiota bacterium]